MTYTFLSAHYANEENKAVVAQTVEAAAVLLSEKDTPDHWDDLQGSGITITAYIAPPPPPAPTKAELLQKLQELTEQIEALEDN